MELRKQVPFNIDPLRSDIEHPGLIFIETNMIKNCFDEINVVHYRKNEGYDHLWIDIE
jgi:hypothetical protein